MCRLASPRQIKGGGNPNLLQSKRRETKPNCSKARDYTGFVKKAVADQGFSLTYPVVAEGLLV